MVEGDKLFGFAIVFQTSDGVLTCNPIGNNNEAAAIILAREKLGERVIEITSIEKAINTVKRQSVLRTRHFDQTFFLHQ